MTVAIYTRVSTEDQDLSPQEQALVARARAEEKPYVLFQDHGYSGSDPVRRDYAKLKRRMAAREFTEVWVTKLDRLGRSTKELLDFYALADEHGVRVIVSDQGIDTGTPVGRLTRTLLAAIAEFERDIIRERIQVALDQIHDGKRKTRSGKPIGRPKKVTSEKLMRIRELREREPPLPWSEVAQQVGLNLSTCKTVYSRVGQFINRGEPSPVADG